MILYVKHLVLMSLALLAAPTLARLFAREAGARRRLRRPGLSAGFIVSRLLFALLVPLVAQAVFSFTGHRMLALALSGALYGATFGNEEDFPRLWGALWGALGGVGAAFAYATFGTNVETRALCVAVFAVAPLLAYRSAAASNRRRVGVGGLISPSRRVLR